MTAQFLIGTSGWTYEHWKGLFYPEGLAKSHWFDYYAEKFPAVEVNATFYRRFIDQTYIKWRERTPESFIYVLKAPRLITHRKYLIDVEEEIHAFWRSADLLEDKLGLVLLQVAPGTPYDLERLRQALLAFGDPRRVAVEFRRKEWLNEETLNLLREFGVAFVSADSPRQRLVDWVTSDAGYIRLHGRSHWYSHDYSSAELDEVAVIARRMVAKGAKAVYIFFNNDFEGYAPKNALELMTNLRLPGRI
jgi:uncharacterized protein YecE (DUF72 family)